MNHETIIRKIKDGSVRRDHEQGLLDEKQITDVKLACYTYLQRHRDELDTTRQKLREWLPEIFHEEIDDQVEIISQAEKAKKEAIAGIH